MHPLMLGIEILTLVPNHLSTQKTTKKNTPKIKKTTQQKGWGEKESGGKSEKR